MTSYNQNIAGTFKIALARITLQRSTGKIKSKKTSDEAVTTSLTDDMTSSDAFLSVNAASLASATSTNNTSYASSTKNVGPVLDTTSLEITSPTFRHTRIPTPKIECSFVNDHAELTQITTTETTSSERLVELLQKTPELVGDIDKHQLGTLLELEGLQITFPALCELSLRSSNPPKLTSKLALDINNVYRLLGDAEDQVFLSKEASRACTFQGTPASLLDAATSTKRQLTNQVTKSSDQPVITLSDETTKLVSSAPPHVKTPIERLTLSVLPASVSEDTLTSFIRVIMGYDIHDDCPLYDRGLFIIDPDLPSRITGDGVFALQLRLLEAEDKGAHKYFDKVVPIASRYSFKVPLGMNLRVEARYLYRRAAFFEDAQSAKIHYGVDPALPVYFLEICSSGWTSTTFQSFDTTAPKMPGDLYVAFVSDREAIVSWNSSESDLDHYEFNNVVQTAKTATIARDPVEDVRRCILLAIDHAGNKSEPLEFTINFRTQLVDVEPLRPSLGATAKQTLFANNGLNKISIKLAPMAPNSSTTIPTTLTCEVFDIDAGGTKLEKTISLLAVK